MKATLPVPDPQQPRRWWLYWLGALAFLGFNLRVGLAQDSTERWLRSHQLQSWELVFDPDGDSFTSQEEWEFGTDPRDAASFPQLTVMMGEPGTLQLTFPVGVIPNLQSSLDLSQWEAVSNLPPSFSGQATLAVDPADGLRFYRLHTPEHGDADQDGLLDFEEVVLLCSDPTLVDTDRDGLSDWDEVVRLQTSPCFASVTGRGRLEGWVVWDEDGDPETRDHPGAGNWWVFLDLDRNGEWGPLEPSVATTSEGRYQFEELDPGSYRVCLERRLGWLQVFPSLLPLVSPDGYPDRIARLEDAGTGPIPWPYGRNAVPGPRTLLLGVQPESVSPEIILGPPPPSPVAAPIGTYSDVDFMTVSSNSAVTVEFTAEELFDGPGPDLTLFTLNQSGNETADVYVGSTPDRLQLARQITENSNLTVDFAAAGISGPVYFVKLVARDNKGVSPGFDLIGFEALHYRPRLSSHYDVVLEGGQSITNLDFGVAGVDRPPRVFLSYQPGSPRVGAELEAQVTASDDLGVASLTASAGGRPVVVTPQGTFRVTPPSSGIFELQAEVTDTAGQTASTVLPILVAEADGTLPDLSGLGIGEPTAEGAPVIRISSPVAGQILNADTDLVGSLISGSLPIGSWQVHYAPVEQVNPEALGDADPDYVLLASGSGPVTSGLLGRFPASTLPAGGYLLRFTVEGGATARLGFVVGVRVEEADLRPTIELTAPAPDSRIENVTEIRGSISSRQELRDWSVEYAPASAVNLQHLSAPGPKWVRLNQGTNGVTNGLLARFDPTLLANDSYVIRVNAWNRNGLGWSQPLLVHVAGDVKLGNFAVEFTDLELPLAGIPITVRRTYDSLRADRVGDFGYGWSLQLQDADVRETIPNRGGGLVPAPFRVGTRVYLNAPDGRRLGFTFRPQLGQASLLGAAWRVVFEPDPGQDEYTLSVPEGDQSFLTLSDTGEAALFFIRLPYNPDTYRLTDSRGTRYTYQQEAGLQEIQDSSGNRVTFSPTVIQHSLGPRLELVRDLQGRITEIRGPEGVVLNYTYDGPGDLVGIRHASGTRGTFHYSSVRPHFLERIQDPGNGPTRQMEYDAAGRVIAVTEANGVRTQQSWDPGLFTGTTIDALGHRTEITYDARGNVTREVDPLGGVTLRVYGDARHPQRETSWTDPRGNRTQYTYDDRGNRLTELRPGNRRATTWTYDAANRISRLSLPTGLGDTRTYDLAGRLTKVVAPSGTYELGYAAHGLISSFTDPSGDVYRYEYDQPVRRPTQIVLPGGASQRFEYTSRGWLKKIIDPTGATNEFVYDVAGRLLRQVDPRGGMVQFTYATEGPATVASHTDQSGRTRRFAHNAQAQLTRIEAANGSVTQFEYDVLGHRTAVVDPLTNRFVFERDALGRVVVETDPFGLSRRHRYDAAGNRVETVDRNGRKRTFDYDAQNRMVAERWHDPTTDAVIVTNSLAYDPTGRITELESPEAVVLVSYHRETDRVVQERVTYPGLPVRLVSLGRDELGRVETVQFLGQSTTFSRNRNGHIQAIQFGGPNGTYQFSFTLNARGERTRVDRRRLSAPQRLIGSTVYGDLDPRGWVNSFEHLRGTNEAMGGEFVFTRDPSGEILARQSRGVRDELTYDGAGQLTGVTRQGVALESYTYDANGNRLSSHRHASGTLDRANRVTRAGDWNYEYDGEGNRVRKFSEAEDWVYEYDHRNRLTRVWHSVGKGPLLPVAEYRYDLRDRRIAVIQDGTVTWTYFAEENPVVDFVGTETDPVARYCYGDKPDELWTIWRREEGYFFPLLDQVGTLRELLDDAGTVVASYEFDSFGNRLSATGPRPELAGRFGFAAREADWATGLIYFRARWYDPDLGRFLSEDPLGFAARDSNLYRYAANRPIRFRDPSGTVTATEYAILNFLSKVSEIAALCDLGADVYGLWSFVANSVEAAIDGQGGPSSAEVYKAVSGALPNYCDLSPINPGCVVNCN